MAVPPLPPPCPLPPPVAVHAAPTCEAGAVYQIGRARFVEASEQKRSPAHNQDVFDAMRALGLRVDEAFLHRHHVVEHGGAKVSLHDYLAANPEAQLGLAVTDIPAASGDALAGRQFVLTVPMRSGDEVSVDCGHVVFIAETPVRPTEDEPAQAPPPGAGHRAYGAAPGRADRDARPAGIAPWQCRLACETAADATNFEPDSRTSEPEPAPALVVKPDPQPGFPKALFAAAGASAVATLALAYREWRLAKERE